MGAQQRCQQLQRGGQDVGIDQRIGALGEFGQAGIHADVIGLRISTCGFHRRRVDVDGIDVGARRAGRRRWPGCPSRSRSRARAPAERPAGAPAGPSSAGTCAWSGACRCRRPGPGRAASPVLACAGHFVPARHDPEAGASAPARTATASGAPSPARPPAAWPAQRTSPAQSCASSSVGGLRWPPPRRQQRLHDRALPAACAGLACRARRTGRAPSSVSRRRPRRTPTAHRVRPSAHRRPCSTRICGRAATVQPQVPAPASHRLCSAIQPSR
jgi:hypothetical protein